MCLSRCLLAQPSRQAHAWLIFDVRQNMSLPFVIGVLVGLLGGATMLFYRRVRVLGFGVMFCAFAAIAYADFQTRRYERNFPRVIVGQSREEVWSMLGQPSNVTDGSISEYGSPRLKSELRRDVVEEDWYYCAYAPRVWSVSFDSRGKVVDKSALLSP